MGYMDHGSLYDLLHNETMPIEGELLLPILRDVCQGLRYLHSADPPVVHGDLKSANVLVDNKFRAKLADFGLSQKERYGMKLTAAFLAPEILRDESSLSSSLCTPASDVYAFGVVLYEVYSRLDPYKGEDMEEVLRLMVDKNLNKQPPIPKACPGQVSFLMLDCWLSEPEKRPTAIELNTRLKRAQVETVAPQQATDDDGTRTNFFMSNHDSEDVLVSLYDVYTWA